jgi:hypothetical protein
MSLKGKNRIMIYGPKDDGTYVIEFRTAAGESLAISIQGAGGPKSEIQASLFGGAAGRPYDPCYHRACDTIENINRDVLEQNTRALVHALNAAAIAAQR